MTGRELFLEAWGDWVGAQQGPPDDGAWLPSSSLADRREAPEGPSAAMGEQELAAIRAAGRRLAASSPVAIGVLKHLVNYIIGTGFTYRAACRDGVPLADPEGLAEAAQQAVDEFLDANQWTGELERELFLRSRRDGECFVAVAAEEGSARARIIEPEQVVEPHAPQALEAWLGMDEPSSWSLGVHTRRRDPQTPLGYYVQWTRSASDWDYLPAATVEHLKLNVDRSQRRGVSDFAPVRRHLEDAEKLLRNTRQGAAVQAAIAFIREHAPGVGAGQASAFRASEASETVQAATPYGSRTRVVHRYEPGTILDVGRGQVYKPGPLGAAHGPNFIAIEQATLRLAGVRWCMPEHMITGDASNGNFASILEAGAPFVRNAEAEQRLYARSFQRIVERAVRIAAAAGRFDRFSLDLRLLRRAIEICVETPEVAVRDRDRETLRRKILHDAGALSLATWAAKEGLDWGREVGNRRSEVGSKTRDGPAPDAP